MKMTKMRLAALIILSLVLLLVAVPLVLGSMNAPPVVLFGVQFPFWALLLGAFGAGVFGCVAVFSLPLHWANRDVNDALNGMKAEIHTMRNRQPEQSREVMTLGKVEQQTIDHTLERIHVVHGNKKQEKGDFFEELVRKIMLAMGYGFSKDDTASYVVGGGGDGGVDVIVYQDQLGFNLIYVQAKCWKDKTRYKESGRNVGPREIRDFRGALDEKKAEKGIFFTTSYFTEPAKQIANRSGIRLVNGDKLVQLMSSYGVGFKYGKLDEDLFSED